MGGSWDKVARGRLYSSLRSQDMLWIVNNKTLTRFPQ